ncbi:hypothetical protein BpKM390_11490 [Burkholderia pseudomallei]|nr:hypothetical protein BOC57_17505 [Burkholderia pseudomallei]ARL95796.1 hypothetical protein BOC58_22955 [Burkholderia pseudomallei]RPA09525.1 hypothetical protein EGT86_19390 [Burkholderia pseudomallei]BEH17918.1 hypothetical protein GTC019_10960 [Burkholderia pseudomallei]BEH23975.1 hypothetical protein GTC050_12270 [Burkholderia pseudomallei]
MPTDQPRAAASSALARPMPRLAPVMRTTLRCVFVIAWTSARAARAFGRKEGKGTARASHAVAARYRIYEAAGDGAFAI